MGGAEHGYEYFLKGVKETYVYTKDGVKMLANSPEAKKAYEASVLAYEVVEGSDDK